MNELNTPTPCFHRPDHPGDFGVVNAVLYERTGSIWPPVAAHATFNLISFALVLAVGGQT